VPPGPTAQKLCFESISLKNVRNIEALELEPAPRLNVIVGDNGQGKTSLLEALYLVATSRSFRAERLASVVREGSEQSVVRASIVEDGLRREQRVVLGLRSRRVTLDQKPPASLTGYATRTPMVVFHPADLELVSGGATSRRRLLDRLLLFVDPPGADARNRYTRVLQARKRALEERGPESRELDALETVMAEAGARFAAGRKAAFDALSERLPRVLSQMASGELSVLPRYQPGGVTDPLEFARALRDSRLRDLRRKAALFGPQRDEVELLLDGRSARVHASQGQQRLLTLSLKVAELECIRDARGAHPVLLLDDVSSELDPKRTHAVYDFLRSTESQVFVTTTRSELFPAPGLEATERADFRLAAGVLAR
jgi:DNA replication and repair protein RecF